MSTLPLHPAPDPPLPLWRQADDRWQLRTFGVSLGAGIFWGGLLAVGGAWISLGALRLVPFDLSGVRVPLPVFALIGAIISTAGLAILVRALVDWKKERLHQLRKNQAPKSRALVDYAWDTEKSRSTPWTHALRRTFWTAFIALFFSPFAWLYFHEPVPVLFRVMIAIFGLTVLWMAFLSIRAWMRSCKFGPSTLRYATFPLHPGRDISLHWQVPAGCGHATEGHFTLRAIEERLVRTQNKKRHRTTTTRTQLWAARLVLSSAVMLRPHEEHTLIFSVPADAPGSRLGGDETVHFWELAVELALDGVDFRECYLVPIYRETSTA